MSKVTQILFMFFLFTVGFSYFFKGSFSTDKNSIELRKLFVFRNPNILRCGFLRCGFLRCGLSAVMLFTHES